MKSCFILALAGCSHEKSATEWTFSKNSPRNMNRSSLRLLCKTRAETESVLWRQILEIVHLYVRKTDVRRSHLSELRRIDAESSDEVQKNEKRLVKDEDLIKTLTVEYESLQKLKSDKVKSLQAEEAQLKAKFLKLRKTLKTHLALDEKQLRNLTAQSNETLDDLSVLLTKGRHLLALSGTCQKFVTERERLTRWLPMTDLVACKQASEDGTFDGMTDDQKLYEKVLQEEQILSKIKDDLSTTEKAKSRPASKPLRTLERSSSSTLFTPSVKSTFLPKIPIAINDVKIDAKESEFVDYQTSPSEALDIKHHFLDKCYESLEKMENFWTVHNKVEVDVRELVQEKIVLEKENKQLRGFIRAVLEAAALAKALPDSRASTRVPSKRRSAYSAPLQRITFH
ncbi:hypothetical protein HUJ05_010776 [Dendroctonus ponderosae]|nr:hypothetical protein HUJ05_010776 [Dendroctonus ponderosae]